MKAAFCKETSRYVYVLVREDLDSRHQTVQAIHAAMLSAAAYGISGEERLVLLSVKSQKDLEDWSEILHHYKVPHKMFFEPDHDHHFTALATSPIPLTKIFKKLKLWSGQEKTNRENSFEMAH